MKKLTLVLAAMALAAFATSVAQAEEYSFNVPDKLVVVSFESQMEVEDILGTTRSVQGHVRLDGDASGQFALEVPVDSLRTGIDMRDEHLRSEMWLDAKQFPKIRFEGNKLRKLDDKRYEVTGDFTMHGVSRPLTITVDVQRIPAERGAKAGLPAGDWIRVRGEFPVKLSDHGVKIPEMTASKVSDTWTVKVSLFGTTAPENKVSR
jgi:polyisoprenoid-binding protein YceI